MEVSTTFKQIFAKLDQKTTSHAPAQPPAPKKAAAKTKSPSPKKA